MMKPKVSRVGKMLSGVSNFLFGPAAPQPAPEGHVDLSTRDAEQEWVLVDFTSDSCSLGSSEESCDPLVLCPSAPRSSSSSQHSCSEGEAASNVEMSPMENLLIEHPSMSVYGPTLRSRRRGSTADDSNGSESSNDAACPTQRATRAGITCHQPPRRPQAVAFKAGLMENVQTIRSSQRLQHGYNTRQLSRNNISHSNKVNEYRSLGKHQRKRNRALRPSGCKNGRLAQRQY